MSDVAAHGYGTDSDCTCGRNFTTVRGLREHLTKQRAKHDRRCISLTDSEFNWSCDCKTWRLIDEHQSGDRCSKLYPEVGHEDEGYTCTTHNMPWDECPHRSGDPS